jgi:phosphoribosylamine--glycine ligase
MFTAKGPYLIEVNCRFGDPETQILMPRLSSDLGELLLSVAEGRLSTQRPRWRSEAGVSVVVASGGYPGDYATGVPIDAVPDEADDLVVFHAGTRLESGGLVSAGGRVLNVSALGDTLASARDRAYAAVDAIQMEGKHARSDIAKGI